MVRRKIQVHIARAMVLVLVLALFLPAVPAASAASGNCGDDVSWSVEGGVLTILGSGTMENYSVLTPAPWSQFKDQIGAVVVKQGVQTIGNYAFYGLDNLMTATLPDSVKTVGEYAFYGCKNLEMLNMTGVTKIGDSAFRQCSALQAVRLPNTLVSVGAEAFYRCSNLRSITLPASVQSLGAAVFAYCSSLHTAMILANIPALPYWTFYGCYELKNVQLSTYIEALGGKAFNGTKVDKPVYSNKIPEISFSHSQTETIGDSTITTDTYFDESTDCAINTVVTTVNTSGEKNATVKIDAFIETNNGWSKVEESVSQNRYGTENMQVNIWLKQDTVLKGEDLNRFSGKNVRLTIQTTQGTKWHVNGNDLVDKELAQRYDLSFTLKKLTAPNEKQAQALVGRDGFSLEFHGVLDFKVEVELPLGRNYSRKSAVFFSLEEDEYLRKQAVMIDDEGMAHFYLGQVEADVQYLVGINVPQKVEQNNQNPVSDVIVPDSLKHEYPALQQTGGIDYIITGTKSSLGINIGQLTIILVAVMVTCAVVVGVVIRINFKQKLKKGYVPDMSYEDEDEES